VTVIRSLLVSCHSETISECVTEMLTVYVEEIIFGNDIFS